MITDVCSVFARMPGTTRQQPAESGRLACGVAEDTVVSHYIRGMVASRENPGDPQLMRMLLLQILTGRRASEICLCPLDCLSPATGSAVDAAERDAVARFRYGQSKIDAAPDTILVDAETVAVIEEQQQWLRDRFPGRDLTCLFPQRSARAHGAKPYGNASYGRALALFSQLAQIIDAAGHPVKLSHTHRFRHIRLTRLEGRGVASNASFPARREDGAVRDGARVQSTATGSSRRESAGQRVA